MELNDYLTKEELSRFTRRSDSRGLWLLACNWASIALVFSVVAIWTNPLTLLLAVILLGGRQLGLAVLMHESGHRSLFQSRALNDRLGQWLCAWPIMADVHAYAAGHRVHHRTAGTDEDPDLPNYRAYPIAADSFRRKILRDLTGQTGMKLLVSVFRGRGNLMSGSDTGAQSFYGGLLVNMALLGVLAFFGVAELYLLWFLAYITTYPLYARIRQVAEHGSVDNLFDLDPRLNTRTTLARWYERLLFCPNNVCYHVEHHLLAGVPCYRLRAFHDCLQRKGFYDGFDGALADGYRDMLRRAVPELAPGSPA